MRDRFLILLLLLAGTALADPRHYLSVYEENMNAVLVKAPHPPTNDNEREAFWRSIVETATQDELRYTATHALNIALRVLGKDTEGHANCQSIPPKADDYEAQAVCLNFVPGLADSVRTDLFEKIFLEARQHKSGTIVPAMVIHRAAVHLVFSHDIPRAVSLVKQALETLPIEARDMQAYLKKNMAILYITPSNSLGVIKQGLKLFDELEQYYREIGDWERSENASYNKGIGQIFSIKDYEQALRELEKVEKDPGLLPDALVFRGFALAKLGRHEEARELLDRVPLEFYPDEVRLTFLKCYMHMARNMSNAQASMDPCTHLPRSTQTDVILHVTEELKQKNLRPDEELRSLQQFYWFYQNKLAPSMRTTLANTIDGLELQRTRYESRLKDVQLETQRHASQMKTYALIGSGVLLLIFIISWHRILRQHSKIKRLHLYIQKQVLQRFLPPEIIQEILEGRSRLDESARTLAVTVLFADLCDFTQRSESLGPQRTAAILNTFLVRMTEVIFQHGGTIDKFMGDGIMVIFGAPTELPEQQQAEKAVQWALSMQKVLQELGESWHAAGYPAFHMRIGIHQGQAVFGCFGGPQRSDFTVIGSAVNIGSRIERMAQPGDVLISRDLARHLARDQVISTGLHQLRGLEQPLELFVLKEMRWQTPAAL